MPEHHVQPATFLSPFRSRPETISCLNHKISSSIYILNNNLNRISQKIKKVKFINELKNSASTPSSLLGGWAQFIATAINTFTLPLDND